MMHFRLERDNFGQLVLIDESGARHPGVEVVRAFPLSAPEKAISIVDSDAKETLFLSSLDEAPPAARKILEEELAHREFFPVILRILNTPTDAEPAEWHVDTDRGMTTFQLENSDHVHRLGGGHFTIQDSLGIRYRIPDAKKLDLHSRNVMERFL